MRYDPENRMAPAHGGADGFRTCTTSARRRDVIAATASEVAGVRASMSDTPSRTRPARARCRHQIPCCACQDVASGIRQRVTKYRGDRNVRSFGCLGRFLRTAFARLTYRERLRDVEALLCAQPAKLYYLGIRGNVTRSKLADANEGRDW